MIFVFLTLLSYYLIFTQINRKDKATEIKQKISGISIVICAKNELENLKRNLNKFYNQHEINYEIIVVNDCSVDDSASFLNEELEKNNLLKVLHLSNHKSSHLKGKRYALQRGVEISKYDYVVFTDADCFPNSNFWLKSLENKFNRAYDIILGYSPYTKNKGLLNILIQLETTYTALQYLSFAKIGIPYMGVGRNIAYKKSLLTETVFQKSNKSLSGDDDLILTQIANSNNTTIAINKDSYIFSCPKTSFKAWLHQKTRHYSTAIHYSLFKKVIVALFNVVNILFYVTLIYLLVYQGNYKLVISLYFLRYALFVFTNYKSVQKLSETKLFYTLFFFDIMYFFLLLLLHTKALFSVNGWKYKNR